MQSKIKNSKNIVMLVKRKIKYYFKYILGK